MCCVAKVIGMANPPCAVGDSRWACRLRGPQLVRPCEGGHHGHVVHRAPQSELAVRAFRRRLHRHGFADTWLGVPMVAQKPGQAGHAQPCWPPMLAQPQAEPMAAAFGLATPQPWLILRGTSSWLKSQVRTVAFASPPPSSTRTVISAVRALRIHLLHHALAIGFGIKPGCGRAQQPAHHRGIGRFPPDSDRKSRNTPTTANIRPKLGRWQKRPS